MSMYIKRILIPGILCFLLGTASSCETGKEEEPVREADLTQINGEVTDVVTVEADLCLTITTDKARYAPGETVSFTASGSLPSSGAVIRYTCGAENLGEQTFTGADWTWTAPTEDYRGYMATVLGKGDDGGETVYGTVGVDVSSEWSRYPRYGFVATFDETKLTDGVIEDEIAYLNRCHLNGVQFQDWHKKHHWPLGGTRDNLDEVYTDIANRTVYTSVVKKYISEIHSYGMETMFYNLCYGALSDAASDGVSEDWYIFKDAAHTEKDSHDLPSGWKSNIYLVDPSNEDWQAYIAERNDDVYACLDFDGYQIDQLGDRGNRYDINGLKVNLPKGYSTFINAMKEAHPAKKLVMNAVSGYGQYFIALSGDVEFLYNEVWADESEFDDLRSIVYANDNYSAHSLKTVFAAYMNYDKADAGEGGLFNTPGVLLTDAVIMALGGDHLELGDHMLYQEYFPNAGLDMSGELRETIVKYYDFMTAYENYLRDTDTDDEITAVPTRSDVGGALSTNAWPPVKGGVTAYARKSGDTEVVSLLNFVNADSLSWRDLTGSMPEPDELTQIPLKLTVDSKVRKLWAASPDCLGGAPVELAFSQKEGVVSFVLPNLKYWTMLVFELE